MNQTSKFQRTCLRGLLWGTATGFSGIAFAQEQAWVSQDGWQVRSHASIEANSSATEQTAHRNWANPVAAGDRSSSASFLAASSTTSSPASLKWGAPGQIPSSPWGRSSSPPTNPTASDGPAPGSMMPSAKEAHPAPTGVIRQPVRHAEPTPLRDDLTHATPPSNPSADPSWNQLPKNGVPIYVAEEVPRVSLGLPIPDEAWPRTEDPAFPSTFEANAAGPVAGVIDPRAPSFVREYRSLPIEERPASSYIPTAAYEAAHPISSAAVYQSLAERDAALNRQRIAQQVSHQLLADSQRPLELAPLPVEPPAGWKNVEETIRKHLAKSDDLLRRNAVLSAREEVLASLRVLTRAIDLRSGEWISEPALDRALTAFQEEADFHDSLRNPYQARATARIVAGHTTPVLKQVDLTTVSPDLAAQHYRTYARQQLEIASQDHPWAADLLFAFGKTLEKRANAGTSESVMYRHQAVACYSAVIDIAPHHATGANQLGYALLQLDRVDEAHDALQHAVQQQSLPEAWQNLAEVYRRTGDKERLAMAESQIASLAGNEKKPVPEVIEVDPQTFVGLSPNQFVNQPSSPPATSSTASTPKANSVSKSSWFGRWWR